MRCGGSGGMRRPTYCSPPLFQHTHTCSPRRRLLFSAFQVTRQLIYSAHRLRIQCRTVYMTAGKLRKREHIRNFPRRRIVTAQCLSIYTCRNDSHRYGQPLVYPPVLLLVGARRRRSLHRERERRRPCIARQSRWNSSAGV